MANFHTKGYETINGINLYYESFRNNQSKETILLIHGFLSSMFSFRRLIPHLHTNFNVIAVDLPPFGKSGKSPRFVYSYENIAKTVVAFLKRKQIENVILIGHSMGGQVCLNIAYQYPNYVKKMILLSCLGYVKRAKKSLILLSYLPFSYLFAKRYLAKTGVMKNLHLVVHDHSLIDEEMYNGYLEPFLDNRIYKGLIGLLRHREGDLPSEALHTIKTSTLLIWGEYDKVVPLQIGKRLQQDLPNAKVIGLKNTGHLVPEERPEEVFRHITLFLKHGLKSM